MISRYLVLSMGLTLSVALNSRAASPGLQIGTTTYDLQKHGSMGRQITTRGSDHIINFSWTNKDNFAFPIGRNVRHNSWDPIFGGLSEPAGFGIDIGPGLFPPDWSGFPSMDGVNNTGIVVVAISWSPNSPAEQEKPYVFYNDIPGLADFVGQKVPDSVWTPFLTGDAVAFLRPKVAYTNDGVSTEVTHLLMFSDRSNGDAEIVYSRKVGAGFVSADAWTSGMLIGLGGMSRSAVLATSRVASSKDVAIVWAGGRGDGTALGASVSRYNGEA
ncbi:MAG: hypothetical protein IIB00_10420, partial [candidate division Zixibacteria bacterium]|nr:hypothetical protein [candidate division Zixibacteria bacterium]